MNALIPTKRIGESIGLPRGLMRESASPSPEHVASAPWSARPLGSSL
jgi:hypothetical protein